MAYSMDLALKLEKANNAYRNGGPLLMTDEEYDAGLELLVKQAPNHPLLSKVRAAPPINGATVRMPYYLGSLDKAKAADDLAKWHKKCEPGTTFVLSEKLDGISGLWNPTQQKLYLSADDNTGVDVSSWLRYISVSSGRLADDISDDVWIRGELIMSKDKIPPGRLGRSIINGIFHHKVPNPAEAAKVQFLSYEIIGMDPGLSVQQQNSWLQSWNLWVPWFMNCKTLPTPDTLTQLLATRRNESVYEMDGLVIKTNKPQLPRIVKGNPKDAIAWKPPNGEAKLTKVVRVEWNASATGKYIPRIEIEPVHLGGSTIQYVSGVNARRVVAWQIGPNATVVIRKGGDVIPVIDRVDIPATVVFPADGTWEWDGEPSTAVNIKQKTADATTIAAQYMKMVTRLDWPNIGPAQMKSVVEAGYTTVPLLRKVAEKDMVKLLGPVKGAYLYKMVQGDGWAGKTECDLFVASPICPAGIGKTKLDALIALEPDVTKWAQGGMGAAKGWSADALKEFLGTTWLAYLKFRKEEWSFLSFPNVGSVSAQPVPTIATKGTIVFTGFRDAVLEAALAAKGYLLSDTVKSNTKAVLIADKEDPLVYSSTKTEKAKKVPGCVILRRSDWAKI